MSSLWSGVGVGILLRRSTTDGATHLKQYYTLYIAVPKALSDLLDKIKTSTSPTASKGPTQDGEDVDTGNAAGKGSATPYQLPALLDIARLVLTPSGAGGVRAGTTPPKARSRALALDCLSLGLVLHLAPSEGDRLKYFRREALAVAAVGAKDERWEVRVAAARTAGEVLRRTGGQEKLVHLLSSKQVRERARGPFAYLFVGGRCACCPKNFEEHFFILPAHQHSRFVRRGVLECPDEVLGVRLSVAKPGTATESATSTYLGLGL